jgi:preprotein translocase subunit SecF
VALVLAAIVLFIWFSFRTVSRPVASWKYGLLVLVGLAHDLLITAGIFSFLGHFAGVEVDTLFVTALLVILGYSVHDKIVVFDRVRENARTLLSTHSFEAVVGASVSQTFVRSLNTSLTTLLALAALVAVGPASVFYFSLALIVGIVAGTYSSLFLSAPLLVTAEQLQKK